MNSDLEHQKLKVSASLRTQGKFFVNIAKNKTAVFRINLSDFLVLEKHIEMTASE